MKKVMVMVILMVVAIAAAIVVNAEKIENMKPEIIYKGMSENAQYAHVTVYGDSPSYDNEHRVEIYCTIDEDAYYGNTTDVYVLDKDGNEIDKYDGNMIVDLTGCKDYSDAAERIYEYLKNYDYANDETKYEKIIVW